MVAGAKQRPGVDRKAQGAPCCSSEPTLPGYRGQPLLINEDDHFDFDEPDNNMLAAFEGYCGWGFFTLLAQVTGATPP